MRLADDVKLRNKISTEEDWNVLQEDEGRELQAGDGWQSCRPIKIALRNRKNTYALFSKEINILQKTGGISTKSMQNNPLSTFDRTLLTL